jgi:hypothetical protein
MPLSCCKDHSRSHSSYPRNWIKHHKLQHFAKLKKDSQRRKSIRVFRCDLKWQIICERKGLGLAVPLNPVIGWNILSAWHGFNVNKLDGGSDTTFIHFYNLIKSDLYRNPLAHLIYISVVLERNRPLGLQVWRTFLGNSQRSKFKVILWNANRC